MAISRDRAGVSQDNKIERLRFGGGKMLLGVIKVCFLFCGFFGFFWKQGFNYSCLKHTDRNSVVS